MAKKQTFKFDKMTLFWTACGLVLVIVFLVSAVTSLPSRDEVKLTIDFGDGYSRNFVTRYRPGSNAWDMLQQANAVYSIPLLVDNHFKPKAIGHRENGQEGKKWNFYLNGRYIEEPFQTELSGGEVVLYKFE